jgi:PPP family 3-phenylpropionic acid transporter
MQKKVRYPVWFALFLMAYYVTNSIYQGYLSVYFSNVLKFSDAQVGAIFAGVAIVSVITQPFWGTMGDRLKSRNALIRALCLVASAIMLCILPFKSYGVIMVITCLFAAFYMSIQPMGDSIILEALQKNDQPFGPIRLMGGMSFAIASMLFGRLVDKSGREVWAVYFVAGLLIATCLSTFALPKTPGRQAVGGKKMSMLSLFKMKDLMILLAFLLPLQLTMGYFYTFFSIHFKTLEGGTSSLLGVCYFISACCEIPYLLFSDRLFKKLGVGKLLTISAVALTIRWVILATTSDYRMAMFSQVFHGWGFIVMTVSSSKYINMTVPPELKASGQMLLAVVSFGIARVIGNFGGGLLSDALGMQNVFYVSAAITAVSLLIFAPYYLRRKPLNGEN